MAKNAKITDIFKPSTESKKKNGYVSSGDDDDLQFLPQAVSNVGKGAGSKTKVAVEKIYKKKTQHEHILLRPDTYIGSIEKTTQPMWVYDDESEGMLQREITFVPGLYKIFDEILVNAADNMQRDPRGMTTIKIDIDQTNNKIQIWNNGKGIPVVEHKDEKVYVPTLIFGHLLTSSNYDDDDKKVTGGRNGYGAKLCNIFSNKFSVETQSNEYHQSFKQTWTDNMTKTTDPKINNCKGQDFTCVTFHPDLSRFKMESLDKDIVDLFKRRAYDLVATTRGVKVFLNGKKLQIKNFKEYIDLFLKSQQDSDQPPKIVFETVNPRWEVGLVLSEKGFQQMSFVNSIATTKGGKHVDYVCDQIVSNLLEVIKKREKKAGIPVKPFQVKNHMWLFINCLIENPSFDSQTKEFMTLQAKSFGSKCQISEKFYTFASKCGVIEAVQMWMRFKQQTQLNTKSGAKRSKLKGIPKLDDANDAGTRYSMDCTLILTEGDSAKTLAVAGLGVVGRDRYGVFPLKGKVLNVRDALHKQIMDNAEINNIIKIIGLQYKQKYETPESLQSLRYGKMMIMTDQDQDGSHIKGLLINFIHHNWPNLLKHKFLEEFITPIVKVTKNKQEKSFYSLPEFEEWKSATDNWHTWKVKYYKGLGTSTAKEAREYFSDMSRHRIPFKYVGPEDDAALMLAFSKKKVEERKEWLTNWMEERKRRATIGLQEAYLYGKDTRFITYNDFVNKELVLFSNMDNERSIPSLVDGFKPGQRKVIYACLKRNLFKELKVAQLAGSVAEISAYHHGENSLMATIIGLAQNFVGSNNLNLLLPIGQFGTRLHGGKDSASPRYIFTALSSLARHILNVNDDPLLKYMQDDNVKIEPEWYMPIIPMILINGTEGIGTGWSTKIPNYDVREVVNNLRLLIDGREPVPMIPCFKNFRGTIEQLENSRFVSNGEIASLDDNTIEITELPVRVWTQNYKETVLEPMLNGSEKIQPVIQDYKEYNTDMTVRFVVKMSDQIMRKAEEEGLHKFFKLQTTFTTSSMVLFDAAGCIHRFQNVEEILKEFYELRLEFYRRRKDYLEGMLTAESLKLDNQARFIMEKIDKVIYIENVPKKELIRLLERRKYDSDPVKAWKKIQSQLQSLSSNMKLEEGEEDEESKEDAGSDYNYILSMQLWCLTKEKKEELLKQKEQKAEQLYQLKRKSASDLWIEDLDAFIAELDKVEKQEKEDEKSALDHPSSRPIKGKSKKIVMDTKPSDHGIRVVPSTDAIRKKIEATKNVGQRKKRKSEELNLEGSPKKSKVDQENKKKGISKKKSKLDDDDDFSDDEFMKMEKDLSLENEMDVESGSDLEEGVEEKEKLSKPKEKKKTKSIESSENEEDEYKIEIKKPAVKKNIPKKKINEKGDATENVTKATKVSKAPKEKEITKKSKKPKDDEEFQLIKEDMGEDISFVGDYVPLRERLAKKQVSYAFEDDDEN